VDVTTRNATLSDLAGLLQEQHPRKVDRVVPASKMRMENGVLVVEGSNPVIDMDGVTMADGRYRPTSVFDEGLSEKLGIPLPYVRKMRENRIDLYDENANGWLRGKKGSRRLVDALTNEYETIREPIPGDPRSFLIRAFKDDDGGVGIARAMLSDKYKVIDHLDALTAALEGVKMSGTEVNITGCDLTERRMTVKIEAPGIRALAPTLLAGYRSPFRVGDGAHSGYEDNPVVFAGFVLSNSETGGGAFTITPRLVIQICKNGLMITKDALRAVHLGGKMDEGVIQWSGDTMDKTLALITARTRDAVATFLDQQYMETVITGLEEKAGAKVADPVKTIQTVGKKLQFSDAQIKGVLEHFVTGGQMTAAGVMNAVTSFSQTLDDADAAYDMEAAGLRALDLAALTA
jgi:hypothetical protein